MVSSVLLHSATHLLRVSGLALGPKAAPATRPGLGSESESGPGPGPSHGRGWKVSRCSIPNTQRALECMAPVVNASPPVGALAVHSGKSRDHGA